ncbi:MAG: class I SAM-dependent methyltransferase, partial [Pirellulales bacterium]|nr:class I SAM-dependent methyltransferase [Pirellulales bacterium]
TAQQEWQQATQHYQLGLQSQQQRHDSIEQQLSSCRQRVDSLELEARKLTVLPKHHPERRRLSDQVLTRLLPVRSQLEPVLFPNEQPIDDLDWMHKLTHKAFPYSITDEEGLMLYKVIVDNNLQSGFEIATAFGYSSFFLGMAFEATGGRLLSVDAYVEESEENYLYSECAARHHADSIRQALADGQKDRLPDGLRFARWGAQRLGIDSVVEYEVGFSPGDIGSLAGQRRFDFAFIDGGHFGKQPTRDVEAIMPLLTRDRFVIAFHDTHCDAVAQAVHFAAGQLATEQVAVRTRNQLMFLSRGIDTTVFTQCRQFVARQSA